MTGGGGAKLLVAASILMALAVPAMAQVHIVQTSCESNGSNFVAQFSVTSLPSTALPVCRINAVPLTNECFPLQCITPATWSCFPGDVTTFLQANDNADACIVPGETLGGFQFELSAPFCCLTFGYRTADGTFVGSEEYCFDCTRVGVNHQTWGGTKRLYH